MKRDAELSADAESAWALEPTWRLPYPGDPSVMIRVRRNLLIAVAISLTVHIAALFVSHELRQPMGEEGGARSLPFSINLSPHSSGKPAPTPAPPKAEGQPSPEPLQPRPASRPIALPPSHRRVMQSPAQAPFSVPQAEPTPTPRPVEPTPEQPPPMPASGDMGSDLRAARARREAAAHGDDYAVAGGQSESDRRDEIIRNNLKPPGTNGIFSILSKGDYEATFAFKGWTNDYSNAHRQVINVTAKPGEDIEHAIVRRMITLIRQYYKDEFNWESLHRGEIRLSARPEHNAELERFMIQEFFGYEDGPQQPPPRPH